MFTNNPSTALTYIQRFINEGEHQKQDFKYAINDSKKIARSLAAFSNTDGGRLLIGVKDNGSVVGVSSEEEYYMIEAAAEMYCKPAIEFESHSWNIDGKIVLEINVHKNQGNPISAPDKNDRWKVFIRVEDQNLLANSIFIKAWRNKQKDTPVVIKYTAKERVLIDYLHSYEHITITKFCKIAHISRKAAEKILINFITIDIISIVFTQTHTYYKLNPDYEGSDISFAT